MKAFLLSLLLLAVITGAAAFGLRYVPSSASDAFTDKASVRLDKRPGS